MRNLYAAEREKKLSGKQYVMLNKTKYYVFLPDISSKNSFKVNRVNLHNFRVENTIDYVKFKHFFAKISCNFSQKILREMSNIFSSVVQMTFCVH